MEWSGRAPARPASMEEISMVFETLNVSREGAVLFVDIAVPPMNLLGPELVRDLVSLIQQAEADNAVEVLVFRSAALFLDPLHEWPFREPRWFSAKHQG